ncbi:MAG: phenylacetate-CoA oxygenase subunit PaaC, partial [Micromonosporaceae bacterium]|nr:phenylacetate-CoA oxygenase subunit PaaC [Micromonosporaceae bacterium]
MTDHELLADSAPASSAELATGDELATDNELATDDDAWATDGPASARWAYGTGFRDPFVDIDLTSAPATDPEQLAARCLMLGDDALVYSHRLQQWITRLPELEEEMAVANIALDLLGQARLLLTRAGHLLGSDEDRLAFFRAEHEFRNVRLVERADADFAELVARLLVFSAWRLELLRRLRESTDPGLAAIAERGATELAYHREYAAGWVVRLGDGTDLSRQRMQAGLEVIWPYVDELFQPDPVLADVPPALADPAALRSDVDAFLDTVLSTATLQRPNVAPAAGVGGRAGRDGIHT